MSDAPIITQLEQDTAHLVNIAQLLATFHNALLEHGFGPDDALDLVRDYFEDVLYHMWRED